MALDYKTPAQISQQYLTTLKSLKPEVDTGRTDSDWWVRSRVTGGVVAGVYSDQRKIADDCFPQSARRDALEQHLIENFNGGFVQPTVAKGPVIVSGATGSNMPVGTLFTYGPNGNQYGSTTSLTLTAATGIVQVQSVAAGQAQNLVSGTSLTLTSPPAGFGSTGVVGDGNIADGRDIETNEEAAARILLQVRTPLAGGKAADYQQFALNADPSVTSATIIRFPRGLGTVGVVITAGTTDVDAALDSGNPVILIPSDALVDKVQAYIETKKPTTDCPTVYKPTPVTVNVTVKVAFVQGTAATVPAGQALTQGQLVQREVQRAIYKTPPGGRKLGSSTQGYLVLSEIEETIDYNLSNGPYVIGNIGAFVADRQVANLDGANSNLALLANQVAIPGTITIVE